MYAVIMAGGKGTRFWPRSRQGMPKHLLDIVSERTIIQETIDRILPLVPAEKIIIVTGKSHAGELMRQLPLIPRENVIIEPVGRNTAPCIGIAALHIMKKAGDDVMVVLPSDHKIDDKAEFINVLRASADMASRGDYLVTIGISPTRPETGYGYLEKGAVAAAIDGEKIYRVKSIREKPDLDQAKAFIRRKNFFWNSGMFIWKASAILNAINRWLPALHEGLADIGPSIGTDKEKDAMESVYGSLQSISIDYGVMERADNVLIVRGDFGWSDIGSWDALWEASAKDPSGNVTRGRIAAIGTRNSLVFASDKLIAAVGVEDLIVVDTGDALLICRRGSSQDVRQIVDLLEEKGMKHLL